MIFQNNYEYVATDHFRIPVIDTIQEFIHIDDEQFSHELQASGGAEIEDISLTHGQRRLSTDSTTVNFGDEPEPPPYEIDHDIGSYEQDDVMDTHDYGLERSPPAHEIELDGNDSDHGLEMEMVEKRK